MADFSQIIQEINEDITTNGVGAITGAKLNEVLRDMIAAVNAEKQDPLTIDATPTEDSTNPVQSGGMFTALNNLYQALSVAENSLFGGVVGPLDPPTYGDDYRYCYLALQEGRYENFNNYEVNSNAVLFYWLGSNWGYIPLWDTSQFLGNLLDGKANKVSGATAGHIAGLDEYGNPTDSGIAASDVATTSDLAGKQDTISDLATIRSGAAAGATAYQKPSGGIPKTDLASGVQTSLGKANTAFQKPSGGIPESDLSSDVQQALQKHFKGWFDDTTALNAKYPSPVVGDYAYIPDAAPATTASIYKCATAGTWADTGKKADTSNVQTFASGEEVNEVHIVNDLTTGGTEDVLSAEQGIVLAGQVSQLEQKVTDFSANEDAVRLWRKPDTELFSKQERYALGTGTLITGGSYYTTPFLLIHLLSGLTVKYTFNVGASANKATVFDRDKAFVTNVQTETLDIAGIIAANPTAYYIRFSCTTTNLPTLEVAQSNLVLFAKIGENANAISGLDGEVKGMDLATQLWRRSDVSVFSKNERYNIGTGTLALGGNYYTTPFMLLKDLSGAKMSYDFSSNTTNAITLFDADKNYVANVQNTNNIEIDSLISMYPSAVYVRFSIFNNKISTFKAYTSNVELYEEIQSTKEQVENVVALPVQKSAKIFRRVGCIGDSYTAGYIKIVTPPLPNNTYPLWSWPHYMKQLTGEVWENWGKGGSTAKGWVEGAANLNLVQAEGNKCQAYVIGLGINDKNTANPNYTPVGVVGDIGTDNDTYYAYYYKLVKAVVAVNADAKIFCNTCPKSKHDSTYNPYNQAVRDIVEYCHDTENLNVYLCDLADDKYNNSFVYDNIIYTRELINGHYTPIGYEFMAECMLYVLSDVVNENCTEMMNVFEVPYDVPNN